MFKRLRLWIPPVLFIIFLVGTTGFAFLGGLSESASLTTKILYHAVLSICYLSLWATIAQAIQQLRPAPTQIFWQCIVGIVTITVLIYLVYQIQGGFLDINVPAAPTVYIKSALLNTLFAAMSFIVIQLFSRLGRFRRTQRSERNWHLLLLFILITFVAVSPFHHHFNAESPPFAQPLIALLAAGTLGAIIFIFLNSIRLAWIVRLSFRQKMISIGLGVVLIAFTAGTFMIIFRPDLTLMFLSESSYPIDYLQFHSLPLFTAIILSMTYGFVYSLTSVLSLIFHLPTMGDFRRSADEMAAIQDLTVLVREVADSEKLHDWIVSTPVDAGSGKAAWLTINDLETGSLTPLIVASYKIEASTAEEACDLVALHQAATISQKLIYIQNTVTDRRTEHAKPNGILSLLVLPLVTSTEVLGTLFVSREITGAFEHDDLESIGLFASQATLVLENARLLEEKIEGERLASELSIAREVQQRLLPQTTPEFTHLTLAASSTPALEVGGDYYDWLDLGEGRLAFIVADVSGKGTSAAFYMAEMQGIFQAVTRIAPNPPDFLFHANQALGESLEKNVFVTAIYGVLDYHSGQLLMARAGHSPAVIVDVNGHANLLRSSGMGIGLDRSDIFTETLEVQQIQFSPGDLVVLYTDGVIESRNGAAEEFGYDRLMESIQSARFESAQGVHDTVRATVDEFMGSEKNYDDDLTLLVIKWHGLR